MQLPAKVRTTYIDQDNRRRPKSDRYCVRCYKSLQPGRPFRWVHLINGGPFALHPDDEAKYVSDAGDLGRFPIGMDCAAKIGIDFTSKAAP